MRRIFGLLIDVGIYTEDYRNEYISLTDIARYRNSDDPRFAIQNWMRNRNTIEFLGLWESLHNPTFNRVQFDTFKNEAGLNRFVMTPSKWIELTGAIGQPRDIKAQLPCPYRCHTTEPIAVRTHQGTTVVRVCRRGRHA